MVFSSLLVVCKLGTNSFLHCFLLSRPIALTTWTRDCLGKHSWCHLASRSRKPSHPQEDQYSLGNSLDNSRRHNNTHDRTRTLITMDSWQSGRDILPGVFQDFPYTVMEPLDYIPCSSSFLQPPSILKLFHGF